VIDHVGFEVSQLPRSTRFYDAVFFALGARRMHDSEHAVAYGINGPTIWFVVRGRPPAPSYGHLALQASGKARSTPRMPLAWPTAAATTAPPVSARSTGAAITPAT
jgi:catechol 2,3-dioxygenase-like lactoylglutathione lyase family enzyme